MQVRQSVFAAAFAALAVAFAHAAGQAPAPQPPPAAPPPAAGAPQEPAPPEGRGQGRGRGVFPAMQRPPGDPAVIERGKSLFSVNCSACHGADARGGQLNGPNLLRSQLVLMDQDGELIQPVVQNGRPERGMPPFPMQPVDIKAIAEFIHSLTGASRGQGAPPPSDAPPINILVGDATAGQAFFASKCASCHSPTGDLQGIATRVQDPKALQNLWVSGLAPGLGRGRGSSGGPTLMAAVTMPGGEKVEGRLVRIDDFIVVLAQPDGTLRSFRRDGDVPKVEIRDPLEGHKALLAVYTDKDMHDVTAYLVTLK
jgi:cytochrome c oxidase cbb3-type subunit 3